MKRTFRTMLLYLLPSTMGTALLYAVPFLLLLGYGFGRGGCLELWQNMAFRTALRNTAIYLLGGIGASLLLGLWITLAVKPRTLPMKVLLLTPLLMPSAAVAVVWRALFSHMGLPALLCLFVWKVTGLHVVLFSAAVERIPREVLDSAALDGAKGWKLFCRIQWPYLSSSVYFACLMDIFFVWRSFREIHILTGDYPSGGLYFLQHYLLHMFHTLRYDPLSTAAVLLALFIAAITGGAYAFTSHWGKDVYA